MRTRRGGYESLAYIVHHRHAIYQGDIDLGLVRNLHQRGGAAVLGDRWDTNYIYYRLDPNLTGTVCDGECKSPRSKIREVLADLSARIPVELVEDVNETHDDYILYSYDPEVPGGGNSDSVGMAGGEQDITFATGADKNGIRAEPTAQTIRHETLHALGFHHEQARVHRDQFITVHYDNIIEDEWDQYDTQDDSDEIGPYDFASIMHYPIDGFCKKKSDGTCDATMTVKSGLTAEIGPGSDLTIEDINTVYEMYAHASVVGEPNDAYGTALAIGDFDNDGYDDFAVGIPRENVGNHVDAGAVVIYKGTSNGPVAWKRLTEDSLDGHITDGATFGRALAALDLNGDGITDLAVGAPGGGGFVLVFKGIAGAGLAPSRRITQETLGFTTGSADRFGYALAAGPITGTTRNGHNFDALVIGAPGDIYQGTRTGVAYITNDYVTSAGSTDSVAATRLVPLGDTWADGDSFGAALAVGDLDHNGKADVVVGAPHHASDSGGVYIYAGQKPTESSPANWGPMAIGVEGIRGPAFSQFGTALAIGNVLPDQGTKVELELVVGAPGGFGQVQVFSSGLTPPKPLVLREEHQEAGDAFGAAVAIGAFDSSSSLAQLVVGAPGENAGAGAILMFHGGDLGSHVTLFQSDASPGTVSEPGDRFGAALAVGQLDGLGRRASTAHPGAFKLDLAIGAPGERLADDIPGAGAVTLMRGTGDATPAAWKTIGQEFSGRLDD